MNNTRFLFYNKRNIFEADRSSLIENQIAFVAETRTIYTHGIEFNCFSSSSEILNKLKFRLNGSTIQYSIDGGSTWEKLIDLNDVDWTKVTNLKQVIQNIINQNVDLTAIQNRISKLEGDISTINNTLSNHNIRITNLENNSGDGDTGSDYVLPTANSTTLGGIRTGFTESNTNRDYAVKLDSNAKAYVHVPWEKGEGGDTTPSEPTSKYKAFAFYTVHYNNTTDSYKSDEVTAVTQTPTGFDSSKSIPTSPTGCTDTATATNSKDLIYMTSAWIVDGELDGPWTPFTLMKDTTDFDVCFNSSETKPSAPTTHGTQNGGNGWYDDVTKLSGEAVWMATSTLNNGTWSEWQIVRIKGQKGEDGTSIKIVGELDGTRYTSIEVLTTLSNGDDRTTGLLLSNGSRYTGLKAGDCFKVKGGPLDGHIVCCNDDTPRYVWTDLGNIQGPAGEDGESSHLHIKFSNNAQPDENGHVEPNSCVFTNHPHGNVPGKYMGTLVDNNVVASNNVEDYKWQLCKGEDGFGYQYIYTSLTERYVNNSAFQTPKIDTTIDQITSNFYATMDGKYVSSSKLNDDYSVIWTDEQPMCDIDHPYVYRAYVKVTPNDDKYEIIDQDGYFNGTKDGNRYPLLVAEYNSASGKLSENDQIVYYAVNNDASVAPDKQPVVVQNGTDYIGGVQNGQQLVYTIADVEGSTWTTDRNSVEMTDTNKYLWKIIFTCYNKSDSENSKNYKKICSSDPFIAAIKGIGVEVDATGADWVYEGDWKEGTTYYRTSDKIPYVSCGYVIKNGETATGEPTYTFTTNKPNNDTVGWMVQYWYLSKGNTEATGANPANELGENPPGIWEKFFTDTAIATQFLTADQITTRKLTAVNARIAQLESKEIITDQLVTRDQESGITITIKDGKIVFDAGSNGNWYVGLDENGKPNWISNNNTRNPRFESLAGTYATMYKVDDITVYADGNYAFLNPKTNSQWYYFYQYTSGTDDPNSEFDGMIFATKNQQATGTYLPDSIKTDDITVGDAFITLANSDKNVQLSDHWSGEYNIRFAEYSIQYCDQLDSGKHVIHTHRVYIGFTDETDPQLKNICLIGTQPEGDVALFEISNMDNGNTLSNMLYNAASDLTGTYADRDYSDNSLHIEQTSKYIPA